LVHLGSILVDYYSDYWEPTKITTDVINFCKEQFSRDGICDILKPESAVRIAKRLLMKVFREGSDPYVHCNFGMEKYVSGGSEQQSDNVQRTLLRELHPQGGSSGAAVNEKDKGLLRL